MLSICVLGSSSGGNASLIRAGETLIMVDAGFSYRALNQKLVSLGIAWEDLSGVFVTHEHKDHCKGLYQITKKNAIPIFASAHTVSDLREDISDAVFTVLQPNELFMLGDLAVLPCLLSHDALQPIGFRFECAGHRLGYITDTGHIPKHIPPAMDALDMLFVESNYDPAMLRACTRRPPHLKDRIACDHGHLSNQQCCDFVSSIAQECLQHVILGHLSRECNTPEIAAALMAETLQALPHSSAKLSLAHHADILPWLSVG